MAISKILGTVKAGHLVVSDSVTPMHCSPPGSFLHGILQAGILEWVAISFSKGTFPTQGLNPGLLHCRWVLYQLGHQGSPVSTFNDIAFSCIWCSVTQLCLTLCNPMDCSVPGVLACIIMLFLMLIIFNYMSCAQLCLTLCDPMDYSSLGSSAHRIF